MSYPIELPDGDWDSPIDRFDAESIADMLKVPVSLIPEDPDVLSGGLWYALGLDLPMPEAIRTRWEFLAPALIEGGFL